MEVESIGNGSNRPEIQSNKDRYCFLIMLMGIIQVFLIYIYKQESINVYRKVLTLSRYRNPKEDPVEGPFSNNNISHKYNENPTYISFNISSTRRRKKVTILIIVSSAPRRFDRRQAIRETWWQDCKMKGDVIPECLFITDFQKPSSKYFEQISSERVKYRDIRFQHLYGGVEFGTRFLYHSIFAMKNYEFDYFLRMDDDYFFCIDNFLQELPMPMLSSFHWGWVHCIKGITRPEESMIVFSKDVMEKFLLQDAKSMKCHPLADQMIAEWANDLNMLGIFRHDPRLHHSPIVSEKPILRQIQNICHTYMGIHGCYPPDMRNFWKNKGPYVTISREEDSLVTKSNLCTLKEPFNWEAFDGKWRFQPKPCILHPKWNTTKLSPEGKSYTGRQNQRK